MGRRQATPDTATMAPSTSQPSSANGAPTTNGSPAPTPSPATRATTPTSIAGRDERRDDQVRDRRDQRQASEVEQHQRQRRRLRRERHAHRLREPATWPARRSAPASRWVSREPQASSPAVAVDRQLEADVGDHRSGRAAAAARPPARAPPRRCPGRPVSRATSATPPMSAARTTLAPPPASSVNAAERDDDGERPGATRRCPMALSRLPITAPTRQMFQPLMATTWLRPVVVKLSVTSRDTRSRRPTRIPEASPAMGSGSTRARAASAALRTRSAMPNGIQGRGRHPQLADPDRGHDVDAREVRGERRCRPAGPARWSRRTSMRSVGMTAGYRGSQA